MKFRSLCAAVGLLGLAGCASDPLPTEQMLLTQQAVEQARAVGANDDIAEMKLASDKYAQAQADIQHQAYRQARLQAEQAELDARLAEAQVLTEKSQAQVTLLQTRIERLRKQLGASQ
ncbi:DUF4398 domain-containing protein [Pseudomonas sp. nanlin1]|uniref:DUF4398 domain-containing protein n=1 Tax=Pseudomonas sp. nanlin1 TaxID=3040605 RepID=UPI00388DC433